MGKINGCLKCLFVFFNIVFAIFGGVLIFGAIEASAVSQQFSVETPVTGWTWVFAIGVLGISCLGIYAGCSEKRCVLKMFAGFMVGGMTVMLIFGMYVAGAKNKVRDVLPSTTADAAKTYMQHKEFTTMLDPLQVTMECCGWSGAHDWSSAQDSSSIQIWDWSGARDRDYVIPESCACDGSSEGSFEPFFKGGCKARPQGTTGPDQIYAAPCGERFFQVLDLAFNVAMGFLFGLAVIAFLGLMVTWLMLHQIKQHDGGGASSFPMKSY